uniref:Uncharacterized protein n=1 Tax=Myoviridae sp. ctcyQ27 TaxID=2825139 RepID=A0A8S5UFP5_9CAUD|nr:MAG TPA: hypothetical protein [Myoviridae sp. ctcyQ27]
MHIVNFYKYANLNIKSIKKKRYAIKLHIEK